jgi:death-on-curing protein
MRYLRLIEILELHRRLIEQSGGLLGVRDLSLLESAIAQPKMTFDGQELYPTLIEKAAALGFSLIMNHAFVDGNKRVGHGATETFLVLNGIEIAATVDEQESLIVAIASGTLKREHFVEWLERHTMPVAIDH